MKIKTTIQLIAKAKISIIITKKEYQTLKDLGVPIKITNPKTKRCKPLDDLDLNDYSAHPLVAKILDENENIIDNIFIQSTRNNVMLDPPVAIHITVK